MNSYFKIAILLAKFISLADSAAWWQTVDIGERVEIRIAHEKTRGITRITYNPDYSIKEKVVMYFSGPNAGVFVDSNGKKLDSSNYEFTDDKALIIKNVTEADIASYWCEPNEAYVDSYGYPRASSTVSLALREQEIFLH